MRGILLIAFIFTIGCRFNNPFYPKAQIVVTCNPQTITLVYEITQGQIKLTYPQLQVTFRETYGGTYGIIDSASVDYHYAGDDPVRDSIVEELPGYTFGTSLYIPPDGETTTRIDLVTDDVENLFAPDKGNFEGPVNAFLTFYGRDGNNYKFKIYLTVTLQRVIPD
ncbi:MAG: hypothetical protein ABDH49_06150 [Candidatus Hydrothermales bacterium]